MAKTTRGSRSSIGASRTSGPAHVRPSPASGQPAVERTYRCCCWQSSSHLNENFPCPSLLGENCGAVLLLLATLRAKSPTTANASWRSWKTVPCCRRRSTPSPSMAMQASVRAPAATFVTASTRLTSWPTPAAPSNSIPRPSSTAAAAARSPSVTASCRSGST